MRLLQVVSVTAVIAASMGSSAVGSAGVDVAHLSAPPYAIAAGSDGNEWALEAGNGKVARITPGLDVTEFQGPTNYVTAADDHHSITSGPDGALWYVLPFPTAGKIVRVTTAGDFQTFAVPDGQPPFAITDGHDGYLYAIAGDLIPIYLFKISVAGVITPVNPGLPVPGHDIAAGSDGSLWSDGSSAVMKRSPAGKWTVFTPPDTSCCASLIAVGPDNHAWLEGGSGGSGLYSVSPGGKFTAHPVTAPGDRLLNDPLVVGPDGAIWVGRGDQLLRFAPDSNPDYYVFSDPARDVDGLAAGSDGNLWYADSGTSAVGDVPIAPYTNFVQNVYEDALGRAPDSGAVTFWDGELLAERLLPGAVTSAVLSSGEWRDDTVGQLFETYLRRAVDPDGLAYWSSQLGAGFRVEDLEALIIGSDEYYDTPGHNTVRTYVDAVYEDLLQRPPDQPGEDYWVDRLTQSGESRVVVTAALVDTDEAFRIVVRSIYEQYLGRSADPAGETYWANQLSAGVTDQTLIALITTSSEYFDKPAASRR